MTTPLSTQPGGHGFGEENIPAKAAGWNEDASHGQGQWQGF
jgi:hypothetical protein